MQTNQILTAQKRPVKKTNCLAINIKKLFIFFLFLYFIVGVISSSSLAHNYISFMTILKMAMYLLIFLLFFISIFLFKNYAEFVFLMFIIIWFLLKLDLMTANICTIIIISMCLYRIASNELSTYINILKPLYMATFLGIIINMLFELIGLSTTETIYIYTSDSFKSSHGFYNPNALAGYCLAICIYFFLIEKKKFPDLFIFAISFYLMIDSNARTSLFSFYLFISLYFLIKFKIFNRFILLIYKYIIPTSIIAIYIISIISISLDNDRFLLELYFEKIDYITSFRLSFLKNNISSFELYSIFLGSFDSVPIDMGWHYITTSFGIILTMFSLLMLAIYYFNSSLKTILFSTIIGVFLLANVFENFFITYNLLPYLYFFAILNSIQLISTANKKL